MCENTEKYLGTATVSLDRVVRQNLAAISEEDTGRPEATRKQVLPLHDEATDWAAKYVSSEGANMRGKGQRIYGHSCAVVAMIVLYGGRCLISARFTKRMKITHVAAVLLIAFNVS